MRRSPVKGVAVLVLLLVAPCQSWAMGFYGQPPPTFREEATKCKLVVYGTLANPREHPGIGATDVLIDGVLKSHPILGKKKVLTIPKYMDFDVNNPPRYLTFCDIEKGAIDPYRGVQFHPALLTYVKGLLALDAKDHARRLRYCFNFLDHASPEIAGDAWQEFRNTSDWDLGQAARTLSPAKLRARLKDPETPTYRLELYSFLLGNCGGAADAALLGALAEKLVQQECGSIRGVLIGYTLLKPKDGWTYICGLLGKWSNEFSVHYAGQQAVRYFWTTRPDVIAKKDLLAAMSVMLDQEYLADLALEDLRRQRCWDLTAKVLPLYGKSSPNQHFLRRATLRYALQCPRPAAAGFVSQRRTADPARVADAEELLKLEAQGK